MERIIRYLFTVAVIFVHWCAVGAFCDRLGIGAMYAFPGCWIAIAFAFLFAAILGRE